MHMHNILFYFILDFIYEAKAAKAVYKLCPGKVKQCSNRTNMHLFLVRYHPELNVTEKEKIHLSGLF